MRLLVASMNAGIRPARVHDPRPKFTLPFLDLDTHGPGNEVIALAGDGWLLGRHWHFSELRALVLIIAERQDSTRRFVEGKPRKPSP